MRQNHEPNRPANDEHVRIQKFKDTIESLSLAEQGAEFSELYATVDSPSAKAALNDVAVEVVHLLRDSLRTTLVQLGTVLSSQIVDVAHVVVGARLLESMYDDYSLLKGWPTPFNQIKQEYRTAGTTLTQRLNVLVTRNKESIRSEFALKSAEINELLEASLRAGDLRTAERIKNDIEVAFADACQIERSSVWRLGKRIRNTYRVMNRQLASRLGIVAFLPEVPMDTTSEVISGFRVPRSW